jgi:isoleucyl-tRNA synthetase
VAAFTSDHLRAFERGEALVVTVDGESHELGVDDLTIIRRASGALTVEEDAGFFVAIDPSVTPELRREGFAREVVSRVQRMRKEAGLAVSDRIRLTVSGGEDVKAVVDAHGAWIAEEVLATELVFSEGTASGEAGKESQAIDLDDGITAFAAITRIQ